MSEMSAAEAEVTTVLIDAMLTMTRAAQTAPLERRLAVARYLLAQADADETDVLFAKSCREAAANLFASPEGER